jgi:dolichol-phosphate mannosyltransferase
VRSKPELTVIVPVYNERRTIAEVLSRFESNLSDYEVIVVDDGSNDGTTDFLRQYSGECTRVVLQPQNLGKTSAVRVGMQFATGKWVIVQDADLEYHPSEIDKLLKVGREGAIAVYGQRPSHWNRPSRWLLASGVLFIDFAIFAMYGCWVRDHATCYKLVLRDVLNAFHLESTGFEGCVEITTKLIRSGIRIRQVPIEYIPRSTREGKKLTVVYGGRALLTVWKYRNWKRPETLSQIP